MEEEHEVYGGDIPEEVEGDIEVGLDGEPEDLKVDDTVTDEAASKVIIVCLVVV
jgi:polyadenylate-binding protein 2